MLFLNTPMLKTGQSAHIQGLHQNVNICICLIDYALALYNYKTLDTFESIVVVICGAIDNNFFF